MAKKSQPASTLSVEQEQQFTYYWYAAKQAIEHEQYSQALTLLEFCNMIKPDDAQTLSFLGVLYRGINQDDRAKEMFKRAYELAPSDHWYNYLEPLKKEYISSQQWSKALKIQDKIDQYKEYDASSADTRMRLYVQLGKPKKAIAALDKYLETNPSAIRYFWLYRIQLMEESGARKKDLYAAYEQALEMDPHNLTLMNNYAYHLATHGGDLTKAEQMSSVTIRENPEEPIFLDTYGWIMHLRGKDDLAKVYLQRALWKSSNDPKTAKIIQQHLNAIK